MKILRRVFIAVMLLSFPAYAFSSELGYMRISHMEGEVQLRTPEAKEWGLASVNEPIAEGDQIWTTGESRVELQLNNRTFIRLDQNSSLQILSMDKDVSQFYLSQGRAYIFYDGARGSVLQVDSPDASTRTFDRSVFTLDVTDQYTDVAVSKGYVKTENNLGESRVNAGRILSLGPDTYGEIAPLGPADEWTEWNSEMDQRLMAGRDGGARYLPDELKGYSFDLDHNGRWVQVPDYGTVWTPTQFVGSGWAPYRSGRWIWRGGDYVWVAHEPWGWAPYHYGRWAYVARLGWCWVPPVAGDVFWSPGYVGWVRTPDYVAWVPLAPGERYYGRGYFGRNSVNITRGDVNQINVTNVYKNVYIDNGATIVNRNTFNTSSPTMANVDRRVIQHNIFAHKNISAGAPDIKPTRSSYFVSDRPVSSAKLPPQRFRDMRSKELKHSRTVTRDPEISVLNPGARIHDLPVNAVTRPRAPGREKPAMKGRWGGNGELGPTEERPQPRPERREKPAIPDGTLPGSERPHDQPVFKGQPAAPVIPGPTGERSQSRPERREKPATSGGSLPGGEIPQVRSKGINQQGVTVNPGAMSQKPQGPPPEKKTSGSTVEPGKRGGKKPGEPVEGQPKVQSEHGEKME
jgi:hypothetical protein